MQTTTDPQHDLAVGDLLGRAGHGDRDAWAEIMRRFGGLVRAVVARHRLQEADARDAEQRTWLRLVEHHRQVRDPEQLAAWLATTARRECLHLLRSVRPGAALPDADAVPDPGAEVEPQVLAAADAAQLWAAVDALPPRRRGLVRALFADAPRPYADIARAVGIPVGSIGPTRARALDQLRRALSDLEPAAVLRGRLTGEHQARRDRRKTVLACTRVCTSSLW